MQLRQARGVTPVGFDAHTWHARNQPRNDNIAGLAHICQFVVDLIATGTCFAAKVQHLAIGTQLMEQLSDSRWRVGNFYEVMGFRTQAACDGDGDGVFVNGKAHVDIVKLFHDLHPELWLWVDKGFAPINLTHVCQVGRSSILSTRRCRLSPNGYAT
jgi:hypothetical protein